MKQFTKESVQEVLTKNPNIMLGKIQELIGCSEMTLRNLIDPLVESGTVIKTNIGMSTKKPVNIYSLKNFP